MKSPKDMRIIQIDITNACVHSCSNCTRFCGHHRKNFFMDFETFKKAVKSLEGYVGTIGIMGGEPTLHPEFDRFVRYLDSAIEEKNRKKRNNFIYPQKDFIKAILYENEENSIVYNYTTGERETVVGAGLWSAMVPTYKKHYELIQDVFKIQAVNDHGNIMYHSPILLTRKELGIDDKEWITVRDHCWAQDIWSATITPKGAFFCEIAGALDMLFDGPGGWPIEPGWWEREQKDFGDQLQWCELCGIAIETFTRDANEEIDDISPVMYEKLKQLGSPKIKRDMVNILKIKDGKIAEESKKGVKEVRKAQFYDGFESRFNKERSILFPDSFVGIIIYNKYIEYNKFIQNINKNLEQLDRIIICISSKSIYEQLYKQYPTDRVKLLYNKAEIWGRSFNKALKEVKKEEFIVLLSEEIILGDEFLKNLKSVVLNPGTLHYFNLKKKDGYIENDYIKNYKQLSSGYIALLNKEAYSLKCIGFDGIGNSHCFDVIKDKWINNKVVTLCKDMNYECLQNTIEKNKRYIVYGTGGKAKRITCAIQEKKAEIIYYCDSNKEKWGNIIYGKEIISPQELLIRKDEYDKIIIASIYYSEIKKSLKGIGISEEDIVYIE